MSHKILKNPKSHNPRGMTMQEDKQHALLDELFTQAQEHRNSQALLETYQFLAKFKSQKPYNTYLLRLQNPRVSFVKTAEQWRGQFDRGITQEAKPLLILFPFAPLIIVYDIMDTTGEESTEALLERLNLYHAGNGEVSEKALQFILKNADKHGILICKHPKSVLELGIARVMQSDDYQRLEEGYYLEVISTKDSAPLFGGVVQTERLQVKDPKQYKYIIEISDSLNDTSAFGTLIHELAHILLGHLGKHNNDPWKDRHNEGIASCEFEAESVAYLLCTKLELEIGSWAYLETYLGEDAEIPPFSFDSVMSVAGKLETWCEKIEPIKAPKQNGSRRKPRQALMRFKDTPHEPRERP
jgi:hypothetical protein